jgi:ABC-2 type transport system permease protein
MTTRPFYWSVKREVWENRSVLVVPGCAALLFLVAFALNLRDVAGMDLVRPCRQLCFLLSLASLLTGLFYSLDALHGERRDKSILFWKSLPVSDRTAVLSKAFVPLVLLPAVTLIACVATQILMLLLSAGALLMHGESLATLRGLPLLSLWSETVTGISVLAVWQAPMQGWLLLVSGWARRSVLLWSVLLPLAVCLFERFAFGTTYLASQLLYRLTAGVLGDGLLQGHWSGLSPMERLIALTPGHVAADPNLWLGLIPTALLLAGAIASRRYRQPI